MLSAGILAAFCLLPMIMGSASNCDDDELAYQTKDGENIKNVVVKEISGKMSSNPSYDCDLQSEAQLKFGLYDDDGDFKFVDTDMSKSEGQFVKQAVEKWSQKLKTMSSTKFGCTYAQWDHEGKPTKRLLGCVFA
ncbi:hypothetical protein ANCCAN_23779 [Ancylostoma caninum]|uniref:SCP domain-containing protein n=1 Tax=Ancylostoma caninum TaxID=29170 RepID=A0A368FFV7_ANCCA|nr:hypothetical protein ANCCAN_23779 [Ancylostoma caninum]